MSAVSDLLTETPPPAGLEERAESSRAARRSAVSATYTLGISAFFHDSAAAIVRDGELVAAAQEERFTRRKHDPSYPENAIRYCVGAAGIDVDRLDQVVFYDKPLVKFERILETFLSAAPRGIGTFLKAMPLWLKQKLYLKQFLRAQLKQCSETPKATPPKILFSEHHQAHAASAFYPSPFERAAVLCVDGVGEWTTTSAWVGNGNELDPLWTIDFPHSLGLLYSAFTYYCGFKVNSGEYKLMGLAPYGEPRYVQTILDNLIDVKEDGSFRLDLTYFDFLVGSRMTHRRFDALFGGPPRDPEHEITQRFMDIARSIQVVTELVVMRLATSVARTTGEDNLCMAGGVALNCVANGKLAREGPFERLWIQPAAGDAGGAIGAAMLAWHHYGNHERVVTGEDRMSGTYLGPAFTNDEIESQLSAVGARFVKLSERELIDRAASELAEQKIVGWFQGRMEFGPRALGGRSILGDPRQPDTQSVMNLKIKYRESFRPFAPSVLTDRASEYFEIDGESPYMLLVAPVREERRREVAANQERVGLRKLGAHRSDVPAVTHVDYSARVHTVCRDVAPRYHALIERFRELTGCPMLVNTSFNIRGEPIVCTPEDAYRCFMGTEMDCLVIGDFLLVKADQPTEARESNPKYIDKFELD